VLRSAAAAAALIAAASPAHADDDDTLAPHPDAAWWLSGQLNVIGQAQPGFHSPYAGANSFREADRDAVSYVATAFAGYELEATHTAAVVAIESAGGGGLSDAVGIAGFTDLDVVRNPALGAGPYLARAFVDQIIPLGGARVATERDPLHIQRTRPARRLELRAGKLSTVESFDANAAGADSHLQFMNWAVDNNGAYDYAADTRGYTLGAIVEYAEPRFAVRAGALLMPTVANGIDYDFHIDHARGENLEVEVRECIAGHPGRVRVLGYVNYAKMGDYAEAIAVFRQGIVDVPDLTATRAYRRKYGTGVNAEQELGDVRVFARLGWNDGKTESFAYTEIDNTAELGGDLHTRAGRLGVAAVTNGLSSGHRDYLQLGGSGFILGDGRLRYAREDIVETYFTARAYHGISPAADLQLVVHPGDNADRGPIVVGSLRLHVEI
jgi:hypothetical protein